MQNFVLIVTLISSLSLSGCMPAIFGAATGSTLAVAKDRTVKESVVDTRISAGIKKDFIGKGFRALYTKIDVEVVEGRVLYTGSVATDEDMITAVDIAWAQSGVKEVINELQVDDKSNYFDAAQYSRDSWITTRIKTKTILERDIKFINYTIVTVKSVVYIFGIARTQEELDKVANIAAQVKGVERVVVHVRLKEESFNNSNNE
jgi:osmotically-inducible protein OsmY